MEETKGDTLSIPSNDVSRFGNVSLLGESILENEKPEDYNWNFEDVVDLTLEDTDAKIIDFDCVNERCFVLFSNL